MSNPPPTARTHAHLWLVEEHNGFRESLCTAIQESQKLTVLGVFSSVNDTLKAIGKLPSPDVLLLDLDSSRADGLRLISRLRNSSPDTKILTLTSPGNTLRVLQALGSGVSGCLYKTDDTDTIVQAVEDLSSGIAPLSEKIAEVVFSTFSRYVPNSIPTALSTREIEVLTQLASGLNRQEVADSLHLSKHTIDSHIRNLYQKLEAHNVSSAIHTAVRLGMI